MKKVLTAGAAMAMAMAMASMSAMAADPVDVNVIAAQYGQNTTRLVGTVCRRL